ncbi:MULTISPECIES: XRE family transcriptional regulator [unclassified Pseudoclavibacter]|uniref:XRE family transcriptional regulator n=1 Tax=unclassified Pseudoclavibacter TaxID=2615177 RepID=UPI000CE75AE8|nr:MULTISPECIES: XRE family transcriptional regulator [unclassified Pseudoclavibacter]PPF75685.1 XRE family transcriptional regulator [Pseudoclavibacter sp. Z016]PPG02436.1 XRE family transcriptional regulator [Pseudoclavibacter sp. RFBI5]
MDIDVLTLGRRIRSIRQERGLTLEALGTAIKRAPSQISAIETGKREVRLTELQAFARLFGVSVDELLSDAPLSKRASLEVELERAQAGRIALALGLDPLPIRRSLSDEAIETILALYRELARIDSERAATPEEARRANTELRRAMRERDNYYAELEEQASALLTSVGHEDGPLSQRTAADIAAHLGLTLHYVRDLPVSTRSVVDRRHGRIYVPLAQSADADPRSIILQTISSYVLGHEAPRDYAEFLLQRVETNYFTGALLIPELGAAKLMGAAQQRRALSVEDLRDAYGVSYETAAHRFTNLSTHHLGIPVHFLKVSESGVISKAYENDSVSFPTDALGAVEGQFVCRQWSARRVFDVEDRFSPYHQYTDKPVGTYWCTSRIQNTPLGTFSVSVGTAFEHAKWFAGRETTRRHTSTCPIGDCCRRPSEQLSARWAGASFPNARLHTSLHAAMPTGAFPGVDEVEVYEFLDRHAPAALAEAPPAPSS